MKYLQLILFLLIISCKESNIEKVNSSQRKNNEKQFDRGLNGNLILEFIKSDKSKEIYIDPIDDTINFKKVKAELYQDNSNRIFKKTVCTSREYLENRDTLLFLEYLKDVSEFIKIESFKERQDDYFENNNKIYRWEGNSDGEYPIEVKGADPKTFMSFENVAG